jgi:hypothetical protein
MNRRDFLKLAATGSLAVFTAQFARKFPSVIPGDILPGDFVARMGRKLFTGANGRVLASIDNGLSWYSSANFGGQHQVNNLHVSEDKLFVEIGIPGGTFELVSADGVVWRTIG